MAASAPGREGGTTWHGPCVAGDSLQTCAVALLMRPLSLPTPTWPDMRRLLCSREETNESPAAFACLQELAQQVDKVLVVMDPDAMVLTRCSSNPKSPKPTNPGCSG